MFQFIKKLNKEFVFILLLLIGMIGLQFVVDIKSLLLVFSLYFSSLFIVFNFSVKEILFFLIVLSLSFDKGIRGWDMEVVSQGREYWMTGFAVYYGVSIRTLATLALILLSFSDIMAIFKNKMSKHLKLIYWLMISFVVLAFLSTIYSSDFFISMFGLLRIIQAVGLFFVVIPLVRNKIFTKYLIISFTCLLVFNSYISLLQYINQAPLGLYLEDAIGSDLRGYFTSDGEKYYRSSGLIGHPTFFASLMSMLLAISLGSLFKNMSDFRHKLVITTFHFFAVALGLFSMYTTYVRSSWGTIVVIFSLFILFIFKNQQKSIKLLRKHYLVPVSLVMVFLLIAGRNFFQRIYSSFDFLTSGSGVVRISLIQQAIIMTKNYPLLGVGLNLNPRAMMEQSILPPNLRGFMFPVHNTFFLFFAELGIPAGLIFIILLIVILIYCFKSVRNNVLYFGLWLGIIAFILNAQVHTLFNHDPSFDLLFIFIGILISLCSEKKLR